MRTFAGTLYRISLVVATLWLATTAHAQVTVMLRQPPPNQLRVADLWQITIINNTPDAYTVYLRGTAEHDRDGLVVDARSDRFLLLPNQTKMVNGLDISPIKVDSSNRRYQNILTQTGLAPAGKYTICVYVTAVAVNSAPLSAPQIIGQDCVVGHEVNPQSPPILVHPDDKSEVTEKLPVFAWLPPTPMKPGQNLVYRLRIVEIFGRQTAYDAITSNPAWFKMDVPLFNQTQYPPAARTFHNGTRYAWQIAAYEGDYLIGESEIWWFTYNPVKLATSDGSDLPLLSGGTAIGGTEGGVGGGETKHGEFDDKGVPFDREALIFLKEYTDPNQTRWRKNVANETIREGALCDARPAISILDSVDATGSYDEWPGKIRLRWIIRTATPIDHIDLRITRGGSDSLLKHFIYRPRDHDLPMGTTIDPRTLADRAQDLGTIRVSTVAVDMLGRSSRLTSHDVELTVGRRYGAGRYDDEFVPVSDVGSDLRRDTIVIGSETKDGRTYTTYSTTRLSITRASRAITMVNNDATPHHFRSVYTPTYPEFEPSLGIGGVPQIDFGRLGPGESRTITLPEELRTCYRWILYDKENPTQTSRLTVIVNAVIAEGSGTGTTGMPEE